MNDREENGEQLVEKNWDLITVLDETEEGYDESVIKLKPRHYRAISLLLEGYSQTEVANELGVTKRTVIRWFQKGSICKEILSSRQCAIWQANQQKLTNVYSDAILEISELIHSETENIRLRAASFILGNLKPETPFNVEDLSQRELERYYSLQQDNFRSAYFVHPPTASVSDFTKYAIDPEDNIYREQFEYPDDGFSDDDEPDLLEEYRKIELSHEQIKMITASLKSAGVCTEAYLSGVVIRDKDGFVVGELHPMDSNRPSYARFDGDFINPYRPFMDEYFFSRPWDMVTDVWRDARGISHTEDLQAVIKLMVGLGSVSIPSRQDESSDDKKDTSVTLSTTTANRISSNPLMKKE
jgi:hypothetical protein